MLDPRPAPILALLLLLVGCGDRSDAPPYLPLNDARASLEAAAPSLVDDLGQRAQQGAVMDAIAAHLREEAATPWNQRIVDGTKYADLLERLYAAERQPLFTNATGVNARGLAVLDVVRSAEDHALDPTLYRLDRFRDPVLGPLPAAPAIDLDGAQLERIVEWAEALGGERDPVAVTLDALATGPDTPLPDLTAKLAAYRSMAAEAAGRRAELEVAIADTLLRYARDMKHFNYSRTPWTELRDAGGGKALIYSRLAQTFDEVSLSEPESVSAVLANLQPPRAEYARLVDAYERYRRISSAGGWNAVEPVDLSVGHKGARVASLKDRLRAEGYEAGGGDVVDRALLDAVSEYQTSHQFRPGRPTSGFWRSLNVPAERRAAQIGLTLQRWRESQYESEADYVFVNIPQFTGEVWHDGLLAHRFKVVVGSTARVCDEETRKWIYPNATPIQVAPLQHMMVNPPWNVPDRIFREEIEPSMQGDPDYLWTKGYELYDDDGITRARQLPGPANALGIVKFIFPNPNDTYMHDTPSKQYFDYPVRAFSHGCVRVHEPQQLAGVFLDMFELGGRARFDAIVESGKTVRIDLPPIPVFFEYYTVTVDDSGRTHFLADPYRLDRERLGPESDDPEIWCVDTTARANEGEEAEPEPDVGP